MSNNAVRTFGGALLAGTLALGLAACGTGEGTTDGDSKGEISIGVVRPWSDTEVAGALMEYKAVELGYDVTWEELSDPPLLFAAVAQGDVDIYASAWAEINHKDYIDRYGDQLEDLGSYYTGAGNFLAVPEHSEMQSIEDIKDHWEELGERIVGIEPGAGLTKQMIEDVLPAYGFEESDMLTSSTPAMLAELQSAIDSGEEIVVTLWSPYWPMITMDVRPLEDPLGAFGETEGMHYVATAGFAAEHPDIAEWVENFEINEDEFGALENLIVNEYEDGEEMEAIDEWLQEFPDIFEDA